jgi:hypothetical protein
MPVHRFAPLSLACTLMVGHAAWAAADAAVSTEGSKSPWVLEPRAFVGAAAPTGDAARLYSGAPNLGVGVALGRLGARMRCRASFDAELATGVGAGASLSFYRLDLGAAFTWRDHVETAVDVGPSWRHLSLSNEISNTVVGGSAAAEFGWRFRPDARWALTIGARASISRYVHEDFYWSEVGARLTLERLSR